MAWGLLSAPRQHTITPGWGRFWEHLALFQLARDRFSYKLDQHPLPRRNRQERVHIRSGALEGVEGILVSRSGGSSIVVSIDAIQRSLAVRIEGYDVEPA
jgi:hypothetical protein